MSIFDNKVAFGLMPEDEQEELRNWEHGHEFYGSDGWIAKGGGSRFYNGLTYRAKPAPTTKDSIDWSHVSEEFNFLSRDGDGRAFLSFSRPRIAHDIWRYGDRFDRADAFASYKRGACDWRDSLSVRPGYEEEKGMTTRKEALIALRDKVREGAFNATNDRPVRFNEFWRMVEVALPQDVRALNSLAWDAYTGSLDAALALHEAVLPGCGYGIGDSRNNPTWDGGARAYVCPPRLNPTSAFADTPARALLLADLEALIAEENK